MDENHSTYYTIVSDEDGHEYIIPYDKLNEFDNWKHYDDSGIEPEYAKRLNGQRIIFKEFKEV